MTTPAVPVRILYQANASPELVEKFKQYTAELAAAGLISENRKIEALSFEQENKVKAVLAQSYDPIILLDSFEETKEKSKVDVVRPLTYIAQHCNRLAIVAFAESKDAADVTHSWNSVRDVFKNGYFISLYPKIRKINEFDEKRKAALIENFKNAKTPLAPAAASPSALPKTPEKKKGVWESFVDFVRPSSPAPTPVEAAPVPTTAAPTLTLIPAAAASALAPKDEAASTTTEDPDQGYTAVIKNSHAQTPAVKELHTSTNAALERLAKVTAVLLAEEPKKDPVVEDKKPAAEPPAPPAEEPKKDPVVEDKKPAAEPPAPPAEELKKDPVVEDKKPAAEPPAPPAEEPVLPPAQPPVPAPKSDKPMLPPAIPAKKVNWLSMLTHPATLFVGTLAVLFIAKRYFFQRLNLL